MQHSRLGTTDTSRRTYLQQRRISSGEDGLSFAAQCCSRQVFRIAECRCSSRRSGDVAHLPVCVEQWRIGGSRVVASRPPHCTGRDLQAGAAPHALHGTRDLCRFCKSRTIPLERHPCHFRESSVQSTALSRVSASFQFTRSLCYRPPLEQGRTERQHQERSNVFFFWA